MAPSSPVLIVYHISNGASCTNAFTKSGVIKSRQNVRRYFFSVLFVRNRAFDELFGFDVEKLALAAIDVVWQD